MKKFISLLLIAMLGAAFAFSAASCMADEPDRGRVGVNWETDENKQPIPRTAPPTSPKTDPVSESDDTSANPSVNSDDSSLGEGATTAVPQTETTTEQPKPVYHELPTADIVVSEKFYATIINDIFANYQKNLGKTIAWQGLFYYNFNYHVDELDDDGYMKYDTYYTVVRYGPNCCGEGSITGFEVDMNGFDVPADCDWVVAKGVLEKHTEGGKIYLRIKLTSLTVCDEWQEEAWVQQ